MGEEKSCLEGVGMEFECFDFENPQNVEKTEEEKRTERI